MQHRKTIGLLLVSLLFGCSRPEASNESIVITVVDKTAPVIKILKKNYEITEGDKFKIANCYKVTDNITKEPDVEISDSRFSTSKPGTYKITVTAKDEAGNQASDTFTVVVKAKPKPKPTPTPTPEVRNEKPASNSNRGTNNQQTHSNGGNSGNQTVQPPSNPAPVQPDPAPVQPAEPAVPEEPVTSMHHSGPYADMDACRVAARNNGAISYSCTPADDGVYLDAEY